MDNDTNSQSPNPESLVDLPLPRIPNTGKQEKANKLKGFALLTYIGLIIVASLICLFLLLLFLILAWFTLHNVVEDSMPRTFAWEQIIRFLGSYYDDCIDHSGSFPIQTVASNQCSYNWSLPWIPVVSGILCFLTFVSFAGVMIQFYFRQTSLLWIKLLMLLCLVESLHFSLAAFKMYNISKYQNNEDFMKKYMLFTMTIDKPYSPHEIYSRWNVTQYVHKCCGVESAADWSFSMFRTGNPRYPMSCCDTDKFVCRFYPNRRHVWHKGCLQAEVAIVQEYKHWTTFLLLLSYIVILLVTMILSQLYIFIQQSQLQIPGQEIRLTVFGHHFFTIKPEDRPVHFLIRKHNTNADGESPNLKKCLPTKKYESNGKCAVAINKSGIFFKSELTKATFTTEKEKETWV